MPNNHLNDDHLNQAEKDQIDKNWQQIMDVLIPKSRNLSPEERQQYGSIAEQNKLVVLKTLEYATNQPHLNSPNVDYKEQAADWEDRMYLTGFISRMVEGTNICNNIRITHDWDAMKASEFDYKYSKMMMDSDPGAGFEGKVADLKQFFARGGGGNTAADSTDTPTPTPAA